MAYDLRKLKGKLREVFGNQSLFAKEMNWSQRTCSLKLSGKVFWKQDEISKACNLLSIKSTELQEYFFTPYVQLN